MTSRVQLIREAYEMTLEEFAKLLGVHREWIFTAENTMDSSDIPDYIIDEIQSRYLLPRKFILGYPYTVKKPVQHWRPDEKQDYLKATSKMKIVLTAHFGYCEFSDSESNSDENS